MATMTEWTIPPRQITRIMVLMGGVSAERKVSLNSGAAVTAAAKKAGYEVVSYDFDGDLPGFIAALKSEQIQVVFNTLHGKFGEDGILQGVLDMLQIPYSHSGKLASSLAMDKPMARTIFAAAGLPIATGMTMSRTDFLAGLRAGVDPLPRPYIVKPPAEGSSIGVRLVRQGDNDLPYDSADWGGGESVLIEAYVPGRELTVAVLGEGAEARAMGAIEIIPSTKADDHNTMNFFDYTAKYTSGGAKHILPPQIHPDAARQAFEIAVKAHQILGCRGVTRADLRYDDGSESGRVQEPGRMVILEVNSQPGMTEVSLVPEIAAAAGIDFPSLVTILVEGAKCN